ncbi:MAG: pinensin family lanthipeptide [Bacteroidia bacterium]
MKKSLKLNDLKVQSFVTSLNDEQINTLKGGNGNSDKPEASVRFVCQTLDRGCHQSTCGSANYCSTCVCPVPL